MTLDIHAATRWAHIIKQLKAAQRELVKRNLHEVGRGVL